MKKLILTIFILLLPGCGQVVSGGDKIVSTSTSEQVAQLSVAPEVATEPITSDANTYKINNKIVIEDVDKRTTNSETYCDGGTCVMKQYLGDIYSSDLLGDVATSSNSGDTMLNQDGTLINYGTSPNIDIYGSGGAGENRALIQATLPAGTETISKVTLNLYQNSMYNAITTNVHAMTTTAWTEGIKNGTAGEPNWNLYAPATAWTSAGGDYSATVICHLDITTGAHYNQFVLMGTGSDNPLSLNWGDSVSLLLKVSDPSGSALGWNMSTKEDADTKHRPYFEITYGAAPTAASSSGQIIIIQ